MNLAEFLLTLTLMGYKFADDSFLEDAEYTLIDDRYNLIDIHFIDSTGKVKLNNVSIYYKYAHDDDWDKSTDFEGNNRYEACINWMEENPNEFSRI